jgi:hypothetical protein
MDLKIPDEDKEIVKYLWKINGLNAISKEDLIYKLSFKLNLPFRPIELNTRIKSAIEQGYLINKNNILTLNETLVKDIVQKNEIIKKDYSKLFPNQLIWSRIEDNFDTLRSDSKLKVISQEIIDKDKLELDFIENIKKTLTEEEISKGRMVSRDRIHYDFIDPVALIVKAKVDGSNNEKYYLIIDAKNKTISHNCDDYLRNRMKTKTFCKHFFNVIYLLKNSNIILGNTIINELKNGRNNWQFAS